MTYPPRDYAIYLCFENRTYNSNHSMIVDYGIDYFYHGYALFSTWDHAFYLKKYKIDEYDLHKCTINGDDRPIDFYESKN